MMPKKNHFCLCLFLEIAIQNSLLLTAFAGNIVSRNAFQDEKGKKNMIMMIDVTITYALMCFAFLANPAGLPAI